MSVEIKNLELGDDSVNLIVEQTYQQKHYQRYKTCINNWKVNNYDKHKQYQRELYQRNLEKPGFIEMMRERGRKNRAKKLLDKILST